MNEYGRRVAKKMENFMDEPDSVDREIIDIQNAIEGYEVRGALASGVKKSFNKSNSASTEANEAIEVTNQLLDESFDKGALNTNIESRLNDLENEYAPRLTGVESQVVNKTKYTANAQIPLNIPTYDKSNQTVHPDVKYFENKLFGYKYWMAHTPYAFTNDKLENPSISVSNDGVKWFDRPGAIPNPIDIPSQEQLDDGYHMSDTHLVYRSDIGSPDGRLECWYRLNKNGVLEQVLRKYTNDGVNWSQREVMYEVPNGTNMVLSPALIYENSKYKMWFCEPGYRGVFYIETNDDGKTWSQKQSVRINYDQAANENWDYYPWHMNLVKHNGEYHILLSVSDKNAEKVLERLELVYGKSTDPLNFSVKTIMQPSPKYSGLFDDEQIYRSSLVFVGNTVKLYYSATNENRTWFVGLSQGDSVEGLKGVMPVNSDGHFMTPTGFEVDKNSSFKSGRSYLKENELFLFNAGVLAGYLEAGKNDLGDLSFLFKEENGNLANLQIKKLLSEILVSSSLQLVSNKEQPFIRLTYTGVGGARVVIEEGGIVAAKNESGGAYGPLKGRAFIFTNNVSGDEKEGAIRYNSQLKKHEAFDGTAWHQLY